jgi:hypothetical protein
MRALYRFAIAVFVLAISQYLMTPASSEGSLTVAGYVENVWLNANTVSFKAKLDTGAKTSSINAPKFRSFEKDGRDWVRFTIVNSKGDLVTVEKPVVRKASIRRSGTLPVKRPVIIFKVCVAGHTKDVEFTLADRSSMNYQILIGRRFLNGSILVDSGRAFLTSDKCRRGEWH